MKRIIEKFYSYVYGDSQIEDTKPVDGEPIPYKNKAFMFYFTMIMALAILILVSVEIIKKTQSL